MLTPASLPKTHGRRKTRTRTVTELLYHRGAVNLWRGCVLLIAEPMLDLDFVKSEITRVNRLVPPSHGR